MVDGVMCLAIGPSHPELEQGRVFLHGWDWRGQDLNPAPSTPDLPCKVDKLGSVEVETGSFFSSPKLPLQLLLHSSAPWCTDTLFKRKRKI